MEHQLERLSAQTRECMRALSDCHAACVSAALTHCLEAGGEHARPQHIRLMMDCAGVCALAADLIARKSQFHSRVCALCVELCDVCAEDCARLGQLEGCVQACRRASALCKVVARVEHAEALATASRWPPSVSRRPATAYAQAGA